MSREYKGFAHHDIAQYLAMTCPTFVADMIAEIRRLREERR